MGFSARVLADSMGPTGCRLTTVEARYPRCIHSEILTHRMLSRSSASSRAIPVEKLIRMVLDDPFIPISWGKNQKGMQAGEDLSKEDQILARAFWLTARDHAVEHAFSLINLGLHKQIANRLLEPWMWITVIISSTTWSNFFGLRCHPDAEPHFQKIAGMIRDAAEASTPVPLQSGEWHRPLWGIDDDVDQAHQIAEIDGLTFDEVANRVSVGRCARVSYLTHAGKRDLREDIALYDRLLTARPLHASPAEHVAQALETNLRVGNFQGWRQIRKTLPDEHIGDPMP